MFFIIHKYFSNTEDNKKYMINFAKTHFITSAPDISKLPSDEGIEIAFVGRSNAGKSTALNTITNQKRLAKTSKTPGRTQLINLFEIEPNKRIVDLPGYGFADVPLAVKNKWQKSLTEYLQKRASLKAIIVLMDIRHPLKDLDRQVITWAVMANLQILILLTKADKLSRNARQKAFQDVKVQMTEFGGRFDIIPFSSLSNLGVIETKEILSSLFEDLHETNSEKVDQAFKKYQEENGIDPSITESTEDEEYQPEFDEAAWRNFKGLK